MTATSLKAESCAQLTGLLQGLVDSISETLSSLVGRDIKLQHGQMMVQGVQSVSDSLPRRSIFARGAFGGDNASGRILTSFELADAIAMSGLLMMTPEEEIATRREAEGLESDEEAAAFSELGNVLYTGFANALRDKIAGVELSMKDHAVFAPGGKAAEMLGKERLLTFAFRMKVGEYPESNGLIALDINTAEKWNNGPIELSNGETATAEDSGDMTATGVLRLEDELLESIPAAPIRGSLAAYLLQSDAYRVLRRSCRRVGLELHRHGRGEIPNPAAHRKQVVVIEVPPGDDRRFDWCRRIKEMSDSTSVVLLIRHPSRQRVTQAFLSKADVILGFPCEDMQLAQKLEQVLPDAPPETPPEGGE